MQNSLNIEPYISLAKAVVLQAVIDTTRSQAARAWLMSDDAEIYTSTFGMDVTIREWARKGCQRGRIERCDKRSKRDYSAGVKSPAEGAKE